jgi:hypothetical protein
MMNERIRELWRDCVLKHTNDPMNWQTVADEFSELIVRECMDVAKYHTPETEECEYTWLIHDKIKEHFGVEE